MNGKSIALLWLCRTRDGQFKTKSIKIDAAEPEIIFFFDMGVQILKNKKTLFNQNNWTQRCWWFHLWKRLNQTACLTFQVESRHIASHYQHKLFTIADKIMNSWIRLISLLLLHLNFYYSSLQFKYAVNSLCKARNLVGHAHGGVTQLTRLFLLSSLPQWDVYTAKTPVSMSGVYPQVGQEPR